MAQSTTNDDLVTVPRSALQALAEWAYPVFASDRVWAKLPPKNPRLVNWNVSDDMHEALMRKRMAFLREIFWKAEHEASRRERALDPSLGLGHKPSLEAFAQCVAEMDDPSWDTPLSSKEVNQQKAEIKARQAERERILQASA